MDLTLVGPVFRVGDKTGAHGVHLNVVPLFVVGFLGSHQVVMKTALPVRCSYRALPQRIRQVVLQRLHPSREPRKVWSERRKQVQMIRHDYVPANPHFVGRRIMGKGLESLMNMATIEKVTPTMRAGRDEIDRIVQRQSKFLLALPHLKMLPKSSSGVLIVADHRIKSVGFPKPTGLGHVFLPTRWG